MAMILSLALHLLAASPALADEVGAQVNGVRPDGIAVIPSADQVAGASAAAQAAAGSLFHADVSGLLGTCESVGEVVGTGYDVPSVFSAFRKSSSHWSIITDPTWNAMGTGQATGTDGMVYVAVVFCRQTDGTSAAAATPPATGPATVHSAPNAEASNERFEEAPVPDEVLSDLAAHRAEIRDMLDGQAKSMLPDWYVGICGTADRRILEGETSESGSCMEGS